MTIKSGKSSTTAQVNISEARAHLSELVRRAAAGEEVIIAKAGVPQVKLVPFEPLKERPAGIMAHLFTPAEIDEVKRALEEPFSEADWPEFYTQLDLP